MLWQVNVEYKKGNEWFFWRTKKAIVYLNTRQGVYDFIQKTALGLWEIEGERVEVLGTKVSKVTR